MSEGIVKITHLSSAHPRYDTRIFLKEMRSLAQVISFQVSLVIADGKGDETIDEMSIYDVGKPSGRLDRMTKTTKKVFKVSS